MPARRLVVAVASGVAFLSIAISAPANAAKKNADNGDGGNKKADRTTTTEKHRASRADKTTTTRRATTTTSEASTEREAPAPTTSITPTTRKSTSTTATAQLTTTETTDAPATTTTTAAPKPSKEYIVVLKQGNRSADVADDHTRKRHVKVKKVYGHAVRGYAADIPDDEIDAVKNDARVDYVELNKSVEKFAQILPWGVEQVSRKGTDWSSTRPGDGTGAVSFDVYVIDTGIQAHADLNGATDVNVRGGPSTDCDGHGTHMAGIVGAMDNATGVVGVAPGVRLHGVKVLDCSGRGTDIDAVAGLDWVVAHGARPSVITMSFGGPISRVFDEAVTRAVSAGFTIVTAAGNDHKNACKLSPAHMGELNGVITVGASTKKDKPATFSNFGPCVDVYAPGVQIPSYFLNGAMASATGTSASAPHVAGVAALYLAGPGGDSPADAEAAVKAHAVRVGAARKPILRASSADF